MGEGKTPISTRVDDDLLDWIDTQVEKKRFSNRTHAVNYALYLLKQADKRELASEA
jgi:Arc/MetJ-type ribon-helix-helix transcriptional regulator